MANKSTSKECAGIDLSTHKVVTVYALAVATVAVAVSAVALRYAVLASKEAENLRRTQTFRESLEAYYENEDTKEAEEATNAETTEVEATETATEESAE